MFTPVGTQFIVEQSIDARDYREQIQAIHDEYNKTGKQIGYERYIGEGHLLDSDSSGNVHVMVKADQKARKLNLQWQNSGDQINQWRLRLMPRTGTYERLQRYVQHTTSVKARR